MSDPSERSLEAVNKIFGDALRPKSSDDRDSSFSDDVDNDRWLRENRPPHHQ
jgi:hypothetical protein